MMRATKKTVSGTGFLLVAILILGCGAEGADEARSQSEGSNGSGPGLDGSGVTSAPPQQEGGGIDLPPPTNTGGASDGIERQCDQLNFDSSRTPVSMLLVLDRSRSMIQNETTDGITRWDAIVPAVTAAVEATNSGIQWGLKLYPEGQETGSCVPETINDQIHVSVAPLNAAPVNAAILATEALGDGTPTGAAVKTAREYLQAIQDNSNKFILLATDGQPSCDSIPDESPESARDYAIEEIGAAALAGIPTFVVGVLGGSSSAADTLNQMAVAGGSPLVGSPDGHQFYLAESQSALINALGDITSQIATCEFRFNAPPPDPSNIAVRVQGTAVQQGIDGWMYIGEDYMGVELLGAACQAVLDSDQTAIEIVFGCPGEVIR